MHAAPAQALARRTRCGHPPTRTAWPRPHPMCRSWRGMPTAMLICLHSPSASCARLSTRLPTVRPLAHTASTPPMVEPLATQLKSCSTISIPPTRRTTRPSRRRAAKVRADRVLCDLSPRPRTAHALRPPTHPHRLAPPRPHPMCRAWRACTHLATHNIALPYPFWPAQGRVAAAGTRRQAL